MLDVPAFVVRVLVVSPLGVDAVALAVELVVHPLALVVVHAVLGHVLALLVEILLLRHQPAGLVPGQAAVLVALLDPVALVLHPTADLAAIVVVVVGGERGAGQGSGRAERHDGGERDVPAGDHELVSWRCRSGRAPFSSLRETSSGPRRGDRIREGPRLA